MSLLKNVALTYEVFSHQLLTTVLNLTLHLSTVDKNALI